MAVVVVVDVVAVCSLPKSGLVVIVFMVRVCC